jgi:hypothetical protein
MEDTIAKFSMKQEGVPDEFLLFDEEIDFEDI